MPNHRVLDTVAVCRTAWYWIQEQYSKLQATGHKNSISNFRVLATRTVCQTAQYWEHKIVCQIARYWLQVEYVRLQHAGYKNIMPVSGYWVQEQYVECKVLVQEQYARLQGTGLQERYGRLQGTGYKNSTLERRVHWGTRAVCQIASKWIREQHWDLQNLRWPRAWITTCRAFWGGAKFSTWIIPMSKTCLRD